MTDNGAREDSAGPLFGRLVCVAVGRSPHMATTRRRHTNGYSPGYTSERPNELISAASFARVSTDSQAMDEDLDPGATSRDPQVRGQARLRDNRGDIRERQRAQTRHRQAGEAPGLVRIREDKGNPSMQVEPDGPDRRPLRVADAGDEVAGVDIVGLDGQSNATATGRMFNRIMAVFSEYQRGDLIETLAQGRRGLARAGKNMASRYLPYGYEYDRDAHVSRGRAEDRGRTRPIPSSGSGGEGALGDQTRLRCGGNRDPGGWVLARLHSPGHDPQRRLPCPHPGAVAGPRGYGRGSVLARPGRPSESRGSTPNASRPCRAASS